MASRKPNMSTHCFFLYQAGIRPLSTTPGLSLISSISLLINKLLTSNYTWGKIKERGQGLSIGKSRVLVSELIKEGVMEGFKGSRPESGAVLKQPRHEINSLLGCPGSEHFLPGQSLDLREPIFLVFRVHCKDLLPRGCPQNLDNLHQLVHATFSRENWLS